MRYYPQNPIMAKFVILIPETIPGCIFKVNGPIWAFHEIRLANTQDIMVAVFYSHYHNPDTSSAFRTQLGKHQFFRKIDMWNIWCDAQIRHQLSIFMNFEKKEKNLTTFPLLKVHSWGSNTKKIQIFVYWNPHRTSFKLLTFQIKWD